VQASCIIGIEEVSVAEASGWRERDDKRVEDLNRLFLEG